jgi:UDP-N-acetylglucosamine--N-acetylmuramyl-(pentapeptide) pyrophosphoryl-undecaprenol N-acetylglucosamine transferase
VKNKGGPVLILAGGTGGHIFPGIAVARTLQARGVAVSWLGSTQGLEGTLVPPTGIPLDQVEVSGVRGKGLFALLAMPWRMLRAVLAARRVVRRVRPRSALALGGYASAPGGIAAWIAGVPLVVHEQNSVPGATTRLLRPLSRRVLTGFPGALGRRSEHVGNPVRPEIAAIAIPAQRLSGRGATLRLLVLGGSQGARTLNLAVPAALALAGPEDIIVRHQSGPAGLAATRADYAARAIPAEVEAFIGDMAAAYEWADLVICRAGALTLAELCAAGVAAVLVPYPQAVDDHQTRNAELMVARGAALRLAESDDLDAQLAGILGTLRGARPRLLAMSQGARALDRADAGQRIADACLAGPRP